MAKRIRTQSAFLIGRGLDGQDGPIHTWAEGELDRIYGAAASPSGSIYVVGTSSTPLGEFIDSKWSFLMRYDVSG